jgi:anti-sigma factor RsiW
MKARILSFDSDEHRAAQELLPWFVNGTLGAAEASSVARHLAHCSRCQGDAAEHAHLRTTAADVETGGNVDLDWALLRRRMEGLPRSPPGAPTNAQPRWWRQRLVPIVGLQTAALLALAVVLLSPLHDERYRTLGAPAADEANAVAVFRSDATNQQILAALHAAGARIVGGPTVTDAYLLHVTTVDRDALSRLRAQPGVLSVEALLGDASR